MDATAVFAFPTCMETISDVHSSRSSPGTDVYPATSEDDDVYLSFSGPKVRMCFSVIEGRPASPTSCLPNPTDKLHKCSYKFGFHFELELGTDISIDN
jgi:hypothetical protein